MSTLERAVEIAAGAHSGQSDRYGASYILHPLRVMHNVTGTSAKITAILHDVVEDSDWTLERLREEGFDELIVNAVDALSRRENESYDAYIERLLPDRLARQIKIADLQDNMDLKRADRLTDEDTAKFVRNHKAWVKLVMIDN
jgi:(p)ppGpp synthase/HD superfamily hydrolase